MTTASATCQDSHSGKLGSWEGQFRAPHFPPLPHTSPPCSPQRPLPMSLSHLFLLFLFLLLPSSCTPSSSFSSPSSSSNYIIRVRKGNGELIRLLPPNGENSTVEEIQVLLSSASSASNIPLSLSTSGTFTELQPGKTLKELCVKKGGMLVERQIKLEVDECSNSKTFFGEGGGDPNQVRSESVQFASAQYRYVIHPLAAPQQPVTHYINHFRDSPRSSLIPPTPPVARSLSPTLTFRRRAILVHPR